MNQSQWPYGIAIGSPKHAIQVIGMPVGDSVSQVCVLIWLMGRALVARHMLSEVSGVHAILVAIINF